MTTATLLWIAVCLGRHRYEVIVFEPGVRDVSQTIVRAKTDTALIRRAEALVEKSEG